LHEVETMAYAGQLPWHGLGVKVSPDLTPDEMLEAAGLDWTVSLQNLYINGGSPEAPYTDIGSNFRALIRDTDKKVLSIVGPDYIPVQNHEALGFFCRFVEAGQMRMDTAGSLKGGRHIWALANLNKGFTLLDGDEVQGYLLLSQPHQLGKAMQALFTPIRVVCNNTITLALRYGSSRNSFRMPHIKEFTGDVAEQAAKALGISTVLLDRFKDQATLLAKTKAKPAQVDEFLFRIFEPKKAQARAAANDDSAAAIDLDDARRKAREIKEAIETQPGANLKSSKGTWWGVVNAVTFVTDHQWGHDRDASMHSAWFGPRASIKRQAHEMAIEYAKAA
jgi:phage/plasmid-like protein (TIGR03299 family)